MEYTKRIISDPDIMHGEPIIKGTEITVELILRKLAKGITIEKFLEAYSCLTREDVLAAISYSADAIAGEELEVPFKIEIINQEDVYDIANPAYIVRQGKKEKEGEGCVVAWNKDFERLTNYEPSEIDNALCYEIFEGAKRRKDLKGYERVCGKDCIFRSGVRVGNTYVLREFWINSKYVKAGIDRYIKRRVDVYIFPFVASDKHRYALHILIDRGGVHAYEYFEKEIMKRTEENVNSPFVRKLID